MKRAIILLAALLFLFGVAGCGEKETVWQKISAEEAYEMMQEEPAPLILDVREQEEFDAGHIPNAVLLPVSSISGETAQAAIPSKETVLLVYCRSGNRSKKAAQALADLGYTAVYEFGGINDWPYETVQ